MARTTSLKSGIAPAAAVAIDWPRATILIAWLCVTLTMVHYHVVWRDEVRALSFARYGDSVIAMLKGLRGDSNPALWHLLLRTGFDAFGDVRVLQVIAALVGIGSAALLIFRSPFSWPVLAAIVFGEFFVSEYVVVARNYGLSLFLLLCLAVAYPRLQRNKFVIGTILALAANANVHSVLIGGSFFVFWGLDVFSQREVRKSNQIFAIFSNALIFGAGVILCFVTVYPTFNDAAVGGLRAGQSAASQIVQAVLQPASRFEALTLSSAWTAYVPMMRSSFGRWLMSLVMFGSILGLIRRPGAMLAALISLLSLSLLFTIVYPGFYRHQALWLVFLITLYWIVLKPAEGAETLRDTGGSRMVQLTTRFGYAMFVVLIVLQIPGTIRNFTDSVVLGEPLSRVKELAGVIAARPALAQAIIVADPDYLVEPVPYYLSNPTYLPREYRFGHVARFTKAGKLDLSLDELLATGKCLVGGSGRPVVFLIKTALDPTRGPMTIKESYNWTFSTTPEMVQRFLAATEKLAHFNPVKRADVGESYDAYQLAPPQLPCPDMKPVSRPPNSDKAPGASPIFALVSDAGARPPNVLSW